MSAYPESMRYFLDEVNGASFNIFKLEPQNANNAVANRILRFTLPANSLLNLRSFKLYFSMSADGVADAGGRLPAGIDRVIQRVEVTCGGVQLSAGSNYYNVLQQAKRALEDEDMNAVLSHPDLVRAVKYPDNNGTAVGLYNVPMLPLENETYPTANGQTQFAISKWDGFLGECAPSILDSSLIPDIVISIFLDDDGILASCLGPFPDHAGAAAASGIPAGNRPTVAWAPSKQITDYSNVPAAWTMSNIHATIECIGLSDGVLDALEASIIAQEGSLRVPFKQYFSFQDTTTNTMRFNVATGSLDRIWIAFRKQNRGTGGYELGNRAGAKRIEGSGVAAPTLNTATAQLAVGAGGIGAPAGLEPATGTAGVDPGAVISALYMAAVDQPLVASYDSGGGDAVETNHEAYVSARFELQEPQQAAGAKQRYQLSLNASYYPQFQATFEEWMGISRNSVERWRNDHDSLFTMKANYAAFCARFCLPQTGVRKISGFDTRSVSLNGYLNMFNLDGAYDTTVNLFCECTSVLRIGEARQLEVVQ